MPFWTPILVLAKLQCCYKFEAWPNIFFPPYFQARKLEAQLDDQMNAYRRLVATKIDASDNELESSVERLLKQLQHVILQMQDWVSSGGSDIFSHTLTRHQEILQDLTQVCKLLAITNKPKFFCNNTSLSSYKTQVSPNEI